MKCYLLVIKSLILLNKLTGEIWVKIYIKEKLFYELSMIPVMNEGQYYNYLDVNIDPHNVVYDIKLYAMIDNRLILLDFSRFTTSTNPLVFGEVYIDSNTIYYYLYIEDPFQIMINHSIVVQIFDGDEVVYEKNMNLHQIIN